MKIYKYFSSRNFKDVFAEEGYVKIKCDYPRNYNDPFELFLPFEPETTDEDTAAFFADLFDKIPDLPTTCFAKRPDIVPMWAHYGREQTGFVLEFDEERISEEIGCGAFHDVTYLDTRPAIEMELLQYAMTTLKPRHTERVRSIGMTKAYFTKATSWSYEQERRLVVDPKDIQWGGDDGKLQLLRLPERCVTAIITGAKADAEDEKDHRMKAQKIYASYFKLRLGRSSCSPFFIGEEGGTHIFNPPFSICEERGCTKCGQPIVEGKTDKCAWCSVAPEAISAAGENNPLNLLSVLGIPSNISFDGVSWVGRKIRKAHTVKSPEDLT